MASRSALVSCTATEARVDWEAGAKADTEAARERMAAAVFMLLECL